MSESKRQYPLLAPLAYLYGLGERIRNRLFDSDICKSYQSSLPTICVGNIALGGTGKTPMVEYLLHSLEGKYRTAVVSRGYKRKTHGLMVGYPDSTADEIGDEPCQILRKFPDTRMIVSGNRQEAFSLLENLPFDERPQVVFLDDGFQHRRIKPHFSILLTSYYAPYFEDHLLPWGRLREGISSLSRADCVVVTKCPENLTLIERKLYRERLSLFSNQPCFFSKVDHREPMALFHSVPFPEDSQVVLLSGIADNDSFFTFARRLFPNVVAEKSLSDHHTYSARTLSYLQELIENHGGKDPSIILTTEKDAVKLRFLREAMSPALRDAIYYLPVEVSFFDEDGKKLCALVECTISRSHSNVTSVK